SLSGVDTMRARMLLERCVWPNCEADPRGSHQHLLGRALGLSAIGGLGRHGVEFFPERACARGVAEDVRWQTSLRALQPRLHRQKRGEETSRGEGPPKARSLPHGKQFRPLPYTLRSRARLVERFLSAVELPSPISSPT